MPSGSAKLASCRSEQHTFLQPVEAARDRALRVVLLRGGHVAKESVLVRDERWLEVLLLLGEVVHGDWAGGTHLVFSGEEEGKDWAEDGLDEAGHSQCQAGFC